VNPRRPLTVLLDLDGTLVDTVPFILESVRHAFEGYGSAPTDAEWIAGIGTPLRQQLAAFARSPADVEPLFERYRAYWHLHHDDRTRAFEGAREALVALREAGHAIGIVTGKLVDGAHRTLRHTGLLALVDTVVGADSGAAPKPDPAPVRLALARLEAAPRDALFVGDSPLDVTAGKRAGAIAVAARWGACGDDALAGASPDHVLDDVSALPALVARLDRERVVSR
jgi:pyrophosphatase PpaX